MLSAGGGIGGIAWSLLLERLFQNDSVSFRTTCQIFAAAIAACLAVSLIFTRARRPPSPDRVKLPLLDVHPLRDRTYTVFTLSAFTTGLGLWLRASSRIDHVDASQPSSSRRASRARSARTSHSRCSASRTSMRPPSSVGSPAAFWQTRSER